MPKGALESSPLPIPSRELEARIDALELTLSSHGPIDWQQVLQERSALEQECIALGQRGRDMRAERSRLDTIDNMLHSRSPLLVAALGEAKGMAALRAQFQPPESHWWWWLDEEVAERRRRTARRLVRIVVAAALILALLGVVLARLGGTPEEQQAARLASQGSQYLVQGDYAAAIQAYEQSLEAVRTQPEVLAALAVLYAKTGDADRAEAALAEARSQVKEPAILDAMLARYYEQVQDCQAALEYAERAVAADPAYAQAYLVRGSALECLEQYDAAMLDLQRASTLALEQGDDALYVLARTRMGMLVQMRGVSLPAEEGPEP